MMTTAAMGQDADPASSSTILIDSDDDGLPDARDTCPTDPRNRCKEEPKWPERPNSTALMTAGFVTMGVGGAFASSMTIVAVFCPYCHPGAAISQREQYLPYAIGGAIFGSIGLSIAIAGYYPVPDKSGPKPKKYEAGLSAPTFHVGPGTAMVRWAF
jgi:hypothetical protein